MSRLLTCIALFDSQNLAFWSEAESCYVCYFRVWDGLRRIARSSAGKTVRLRVRIRDADLFSFRFCDAGSSPR